MLEGGLELHAPDAEAPVADHHDDLLAGACELRADRHRGTVTDRGERSGIHDLPREAGADPLREPAREREAVDDEGGIVVHHVEQLRRQPRGMDRHGIVHLGFLSPERLFEGVADLRDLAQPRPGMAPLAVQSERRGPLDELCEDELRVPHDGDLRLDVPADARGDRIDLDVRRIGVPRGRTAEMLAAPELEADGEDDVGAPREGLLPGTPHRERVIFRQRALARAARVHRNLQRPGEGT